VQQTRSVLAKKEGFLLEAISKHAFEEVAATAPQPEMYFDCHACDGRMVLSYEDHPVRYKEVELILRNLSYWQCQGCEEGMYGMSTFCNHLKRAQEQYDATGQTEYDCL
ncbi:MAG: YgiT-type zinc finger protein, partial [Tumebacillaceae bacterium]